MRTFSIVCQQDCTSNTVPVHISNFSISADSFYKTGQ